MKTRYGKALLKQASKQKDGVIKRMTEIALEFKKASARDFSDANNEKYGELMDEFIELEKESAAYQSIINAMIRIEHFIPEPPEKPRITNPRGEG